MKSHIPYCWFGTNPICNLALQNGTQKHPKTTLPTKATALGHPDLPPESLSSDMEAWLAAPWWPVEIGGFGGCLHI